ncbi:DUF1761 domain-containing protein [Flavobacteriales bacterium]|jgi:hypothetical protein|nr:DUF1761 domain-containing protein [Flavobacteriales bacterium]
MTGYYGYELNWLGIALAALAPLLIGMIWYHPKAFGKAWMDSLGFSEDDLKKGNMAVTLAVAFLMSFTLAYYFAMRYHAHGDNGVMAHAAYHGFMTFGYLGMPVLVTNLLFERRSWQGILINVGYWFLAIMALVLVVHLIPGAEVPEAS